MGERKGTNKYYPPDYDPKAGGLNKFLGTHALRERARKIHMGIIIIRFEMPYNIWCEGCNNHIGMGVRYNAEKKKVGMYYTTPVYEFKMKCHLCDNHFIIKTDPGNLDYIILSGARRQENRWDPTKNEQVVPETKEVQKRLFDDSMYKLEHVSTDQNTAESQKPRLVKLYDRNESTWSDHYTSNQKLRENFRKRNKALNQTAEEDQMLLKKSCLDIPLLPEKEEDKKYASLLSKVPCRNSSENNELRLMNIISRPALPSSNLNYIKEQKAIKIMTSVRKDLGIVPKKVTSGTSEEINIQTNKSKHIECDPADISVSNDDSIAQLKVDQSTEEPVEKLVPNLLPDELHQNIHKHHSTNDIIQSDPDVERIASRNLDRNFVMDTEYAACHRENQQNDIVFSERIEEHSRQTDENICKEDNKTEYRKEKSLSLVGDYGSSSDTE